MTNKDLLDIQSILGKGGGVVAAQAIASNTVIEIAPVAPFPATERVSIDATHLGKYYFVQPEAYQYGKNVDGYLVFEQPKEKSIQWLPDSYVVAVTGISTNHFSNPGSRCHCFSSSSIALADKLTPVSYI